MHEDAGAVDFEDNLAKHLSVIWRHLNVYAARRLSHLGVGVGQYPYLLALYVSDGQTQQELSDMLVVNKSGTAVAIAKLEELGYVTRRLDSKDRRYTRVFLTESGRRVRSELEAVVADTEEMLRRGLGAEEYALAGSLLRSMAANVLEETDGAASGDAAAGGAADDEFTVGDKA